MRARTSSISSPLMSIGQYPNSASTSSWVRPSTSTKSSRLSTPTWALLTGSWALLTVARELLTGARALLTGQSRKLNASFPATSCIGLVPGFV